MTARPAAFQPRPVVCTGQRVDRLAQPVYGSRCGRRLEAPVDVGRAAGWRIGEPDDFGFREAMCPRCAAPRATGDDETEPVGNLPGQLQIPGLGPTAADTDL